MENDKDRPKSAKLPHGPAIRQTKSQRGAKSQTRGDGGPLKQLHDLQVQRIELEMQNDELKKVRAELHVALDRRNALYEFAPVVLLTLTEDGSITECNFAATQLLRMELSRLLERRLGSFVVAGSFPAFHGCLYSIFHGEQSQHCDVALLRDDGSRIVVKLTLVRRQSDSTCLAALADVTENYEVLEQNRTLARRLFELLESDRRNIAHEIHDDLHPWLNATYAATAAMLRTEHKLAPETKGNIRTVIANAAEMQNVLRRILLKLRPTMLDTVGLGGTLQELVSQWREINKSTTCVLMQDGYVDDLGESLNITIFRIVQEALDNVAKHAQAATVEINLGRVAGTDQTLSSALVLTIKDNGKGFNPVNPASGTGILGMRERAIAVEGSFEISSELGQGTVIKVRLPTKLGAQYAAR